MSGVHVSDLTDAVERAFAVTGRGLAPWPAPHVDRGPSDDEYSRVTDGARWRIVGARADAWLRALEETNVARVNRDTTVRWVSVPRTRISTTSRAVPHRPGALNLVVASSGAGELAGSVVTLGVGDPAVCIGWVPDCGCDACDSGSQNELDQVDRIVLGVVSGTFRRLTSGDRTITQLDANGWNASGDVSRREVAAALVDPHGWDEVSGVPWIAGP